MATIDFTTDAPVASNLDVAWIHGAPRRHSSDEPPIQVHQHDPHTFVLRQSKLISYEAPFIYLLFGADRALLLDTGATADPGRFPLRQTIDRIVEQWLTLHPQAQYELVVAHTHGHLDHVRGDGQFTDRPNTVIVERDLEKVRSHFGLHGPDVAAYDLGGRTLEVMATPGHHRTAITVFDPWTGWLLTGDTVYPGRLYAFDYPAFLASLDRIVAVADTRQVTHVMGCHVEMTRTPGRDYPIGSTYQPNEAPLPMTVDQLRAVREAAQSVAAIPGAHTFDDFLIFHGRCTRATLSQVGRNWWRRLRGAVAPRSLS